MRHVFTHARPRWLTIAAAAIVAIPAALVGAQPALAAGTTYYVDSAAGSDTNAGTSPSDPWHSLAKVNSTGFAPGDSVLFKGGSIWTGSLLITSSGTSSAPITIGSYGTGRPLLNGATTATNTVEVQNAHDVTITGLEITNSSDFAASTSHIYRGIYVEAKDLGEVPGILIENNDVHTVDGVGASGGIGNGGIAVGVRGNTTPTWYSGLRITGNEVADINAYGISTFTTWCAGCEIYSSETGIPATEVASTRVPYTGLSIDSNYVHDVTGGGITPQYADNVLVQYNTVDRAASHQLVAGGGNVGIWWQGTDGILVQRNTVRHTASEGIYSNADALAFDADMGTTHSTVQDNISDSNNGGFFMCLISSYNNQVRYNLSVDDKRLTFRFLSGCANTRAYNNTIWATATPAPTLTAPGVPGAPEPMVGIIAADTSSNSVSPTHTLADNIIYNPANVPYNVSGQKANHYSHNLYWSGASSTTPAANDPAPAMGDPAVANPAAALPASGFITPAQFTAYVSAYTPDSGSPARGIGVSEWGQTKDELGTAVPMGAVDAGAIQHAVTETASTTLGTSIGNIANVVDGRSSTSWASADSPTFPGNVTVQFGEARTFDAVTLAAAFGQGQGPTSVDVQTWNGSSWVTSVRSASLNWHQNSTNVEYAKVPLPAAVSTTQLRLLVRAGNTTWGHIALYEVGASYQGVAATSMGELSATNTTAALIDDDTATSWASSSGSLGYIEIDSPPVTADSITFQVAFGQGQGPTSVFVQALNGDDGPWQTVVPITALSWSQNTSTVESRTVTFHAPMTATRFEIQIRGANLTWGHVALNEVSVQ
ncbi:dTDP-4-dehydrorhamnose reductase [Leifsonia xyli subsp. cynodontis DSM 46306]|uniref:F5/8 type C domain-containing protein n=1 Tax=Leifsonia xyli subsp. cynodontis DSM 46306 TaxID=1389489 RepID=U3P7F5_LEIXC|nr:discoidin domain-containing protein [Leifsonia xyli]AGW41771.1 dTDP-4-dehydrorhamnose reductase [Leifsonia xyli subsp. cynodontis DSM 46306]